MAVLPQNPSFPSLLSDIKILMYLLSQEIIFHSLERIKSWRTSIAGAVKYINRTPFRRNTCSEVEVFHETTAMGVAILDLPELALDSILAKLSAAELCEMARVCRPLREKCRSDELWERHVRDKWGGVVGERRDFCHGEVETKGRMSRLASVWPLSWIKNRVEAGRKCRRAPRPASLADFYLALQSGRLPFPAQIFNREYGRTGFLMSCYDAEVTYNARTNKFSARYPPHGKRVAAIEAVPWARTRAPCVATCAHELHVSDCLGELKPGDHFEIQWRRSKEFPYGWWFGVVGHLETCDSSKNLCRCHASDSIVLEFKHYAEESRWRRKAIHRKEHREDGDENGGFYGGIRKVGKQEDISKWMQFWPTQPLE